VKPQCGLEAFLYWSNFLLTAIGSVANKNKLRGDDKLLNEIKC